MKSDLESAMARYDARLAQVPTAAGTRRVWERLQASVQQQPPPPRSERRPRIATAAWAGLTVALAGVVVAVAPRILRRGSDAATEIGGFSVLESPGFTVLASSDESVEVVSGRGTLTTTGIALETEAGARLRRESRGVRVVRGVARIRVRPRGPGEEPARILVSGGAIEVVGTRFVVTEQGQQGEVTLEEGKIRFVTPDGQHIDLLPGETHHWPAPPREPNAATSVEVAPAARVEERATSGARPARAPPSTADIDRFLEHIYELRARGDYETALTDLERELRGPLRPDTRERLSYELGAILTQRVADRDRACRHWQRHNQLYGGGRYERQIRRLSSSLRCDARR